MDKRADDADNAALSRYPDFPGGTPVSRMRRRMVHAYERAAQPTADHWLQQQFPHLRVERRALAAALAWALFTALPAAVRPAADGGAARTFLESLFAPRFAWTAYLGQAALYAVLAGAFLMALARTMLPADRRVRAEWGVAAIATATVWAGYFLTGLGWGLPWLATGLAAGLVALGMAALPLAVWTATLVAVAAIVATGAELNAAAAVLAATWVSATLVRGVRRRWLLTVVAFLSGAAGLLVEAALIAGAGGNPVKVMGLDNGEALSLAAFVLAWGASGPALAVLIRPMENWFGVTTRMRLQSLLDMEHPLMRRLVAEAPGTYNHALLVGALAEAGAEAAGGDGLLAKAGGYFHDIGKLFKPGYFTENEMGVSRHDRLSPYMSALVIMAHVKDGGELAEAFNLPPAVVHIIRSHHGTSDMVYFLKRAEQQARPGEKVAVSQFRYPGPRPRTVEAAAVMLADAIEAAARSAGGGGTERLRKQVHQIVQDRLLKGQLSESGLDLTRLQRMETEFLRVLLGMYHGRVKYPGQEDERRRR